MRARRTGRCSWCGTPIAVGNEILPVHEGDLFRGTTRWVHARCEPDAQATVANAYDPDPDDYAAIHCDIGDK